MFYLGIHRAHWLERTDVPLFLSYRQLCKRRSFPRARGPWILDSAGFSELSQYGRWTVEPERYINDVRLYHQEIGRLQFAAIQDWMCEPQITAHSGLTVKQHIHRTIDSYLCLANHAPDLPWMPVLQGWTLHDYEYCRNTYEAEGIDLASFPLVGLGTMCRRQATSERHHTMRP